MKKIFIADANIVNDGKIFSGNVLIEGEIIAGVGTSVACPSSSGVCIVDAKGKFLLPGVIDDQVHFREPGLTHKAEIYTEAKAAVTGGVTSYMEMPNTIPNTLTQKLLEAKYQRASEVSLANYSFYMGVSNNNLEEVLKTNPRNVCGVKIFMGSSTGNMLVDNPATLENIFSECKLLIAAHCEDEETIRRNSEKFRKKYGKEIPVKFHPQIRSEEACYKCSSLATKLAKKYNARLHLLHISTEKELELLDETIPLNKKRITAEACIHHLWFSDEDYLSKGSFIKWNPAIKTRRDRDAILRGVIENKIDVIATDHAPHTLEEKRKNYFECPSGGPMVQHSLVVMLELVHQKKITLEKVVEKMCHAVAECFRIEKRGFIREGYFADLVLVDMNAGAVPIDNLFYKCGWSPFQGDVFHSKVTHTFVNGHLVYNNGKFDESKKGMRLLFNRN